MQKRHNKKSAFLNLALPRFQSGFTLIEVLVVVAIIGIIAAIAIPSYSRYITKANHTDATSFLSELAGEQQRFFSQNNTYTADLSELGYGSEENVTSPEGHYTVSAEISTTGTQYTLSATPVVGGRQANDTLCSTFTISSTGIKANTGGSRDNCW